MYYSIYPKLRAIYSFLPTIKEEESLIKARGLSGFNKRIKELKILKRFPLKDNNIERHFTLIPFELCIVVYNRLSGSPKRFFKNYMRIYELKDIKRVLHGTRGRYFLYLEKEKLALTEIGESLQGGFWDEVWDKGYSRYRDTEKISDIEIELDHHYYRMLLKTADELPLSDRLETKELILNWINLQNKVWLYRLKQYYNMEAFEIRRFLIPEGYVYQEIEDTEGITKISMKMEFYKTCYKDFKMKMFSMKSILAFFVLLNLNIEGILSIYNAKLLDIEEERIKTLIGIL